jgi:acyl carrier protein
MAEQATPSPATPTAPLNPGVFERVVRALSLHLCVQPEDIEPDRQLVAHLGADSLDLVELQFSLDDEFGTELADDALMKPGITVAGVLEALRAHGVQG